MKYLIAICAFIALAAHAQQCTTLIYTGAPFSNMVMSAQAFIGVSVPIAGTVTLAEPLPTNAVNQSVTPTDWQFNNEATAGMYVITQSFIFTTVSGVITDWSVAFTRSSPATGFATYNISATLTPAKDSLSITQNGGCFGPNCPDSSSFTGSSTYAGTWACPPVDPLAAEVASLRAQLAAVTFERNEYINLFRIADQEIAALEAKK
jgi:hypothetical protein